MSTNNTQEEQPPSALQSLRRHAVAALVLVICAWILLHFLFHVVVVVATVVAIVLAIVGAIWAIRVLF